MHKSYQYPDCYQDVDPVSVFATTGMLRTEYIEGYFDPYCARVIIGCHKSYQYPDYDQ